MHCKICNEFLTYAEEQHKNFYKENEYTCFTCLKEAGIIIPAVNDNRVAEDYQDVPEEYIHEHYEG